MKNIRNKCWTQAAANAGLIGGDNLIVGLGRERLEDDLG